jgi:hypothetical protein
LPPPLTVVETTMPPFACSRPPLETVVKLAEPLV